MLLLLRSSVVVVIDDEFALVVKSIFKQNKNVFAFLGYTGPFYKVMMLEGSQTDHHHCFTEQFSVNSFAQIE